ncbi:hypothetical protein EON65_03735 [archaeon]|nr:MAG: hypothetical protein EON65_03735 [archaeon]
MDDDDNIYDVVDEDKYAELVEKRRKAGDFVVDDGTNNIVVIYFT